ncbi:DUF6541 family protein [Microbacterium aquimaris]|uniref:DUF6541 family protein n=1 Tax=Microbacterium aquimaris TaxID=459816 RepID=UPI002AD5916A|nr:DUF6541 family protein [Microbacterium aquimaris]MDZ8274545.1 DUF6541 family protein [Microbacterium aquimaris]
MMNWLDASGAILVAGGALFIPGLIVLAAGWRWSVRLLLLAPAVSIAVIALAAVFAPLVGLGWGLIPVGVVSASLALLAAIFRVMFPMATEGAAQPRVASSAVAYLSLAVATLLLGAQSMIAFISPENIAQTFDTIVHLNSVALAVSDENASAFAIATQAGSSFYPNAWAALSSLVAVVAGVNVPIAANAATVAIVAVLWPASALAFAWTAFAARPVALVATGTLSAAFGAFPWIMLYFGVLYPNLTGYAVIPAVLAVAFHIRRSLRSRGTVKEVALFLLLIVGAGLGHPNAIVAHVYIMTVLALLDISLRAVKASTTNETLVLLGAGLLVIVVAVVFRQFVSTSEGASGWGPWQSPAQAFGEGILAHPAQLPVTLTVAGLVVFGLLTVVVRRADFSVVVPFIVVVVLFILVSGYPVGTRMRDALTNPWYNDSFRVAALLGVVALPVATLGVVRISGRIRRSFLDRSPRVILAGSAVAGFGLLLSASVGPGVSTAIERVQDTYRYSESSYLITEDERALLAELPDLVEPDALIAGSPRTGASLALAFADRDVLDFHIFGPRTDAEDYLNRHLADIDVDPAVCRAVNETGVDYVLDFGGDGVGNVEVDAWDGIVDLAPSDRLVVVDEIGDARLFAIEGCP